MHQHVALQRLKSDLGGQRQHSRRRAIPQAMQQQAAKVLGHDFSKVKLYEGPVAPALGAWGAAMGDEIHVAEGELDFNSPEVRRRVRHEMVHVAQQRDGRVRANGRVGGLPLNDHPALEGEADRLADALQPGGGGASEGGGAESAMEAGAAPAVQLGWWDDMKTSMSSGFSRHVYGPHTYDVTHPVDTQRSGETSEDTQRRIYEAMVQHPAPGGRHAATPGGTQMTLPIGRIESTSDPERQTVTNVTQTPHLLHPGQVTRSVVPMGGGQYGIRSYGTGHGVLPSLNNYLADTVWRGPAYQARLHTSPEARRQHFQDVMEHVAIG